MHTDIYRDTMYPIELFGKNALYTEGTVPREEVPGGWYRYDLCGTEQKPDKPLKLTDTALEFHTGTVLSPVPLKRNTTLERKVNGQLFAEGRPITLAQFCEEQNLPCPQDPRKYVLRPASPMEAGRFYAQAPEEDEKQGAIGHVRIDFGHGGKEFWHTWWPRGPEELNTPQFKAELGEVVDELRKGVLKDLPSMRHYCRQHDGEIGGRAYAQNYGYVVETDRYLYRLRCNPVENDYQGYLSCFDKQAQRLEMAKQAPIGRITFASGEQLEFTDPDKYLQAVREELPFHSTTGFRYETLTNDPEVRKAVDDMVCDLYGEENPRVLEEYETAPEQDMTMGGPSL